MFNFKSAGIKSNDQSLELTIPKKVKPIGLQTPLQLSYDSNLYATHIDPLLQIKDNFKNLILTNKGERLGRYNFGVSLNEVLFDITALDNFEQIISNKIIEASKVYIPQATISNITVKIVNSGEVFTALAQNEILEINYPNDSTNIFGNEDPSLINQLAKIKIEITYNVPILSVSNQKITVQMFIGG